MASGTRRVIPWLLALFLAVPPGGALAAQGHVIEQVLVKVNGDIITQTDLESRQAAAVRERLRQDVDPQVLKNDAALKKVVAEVTPRVIVDAVDELLLLQLGRERNYHLTDEQFFRGHLDLVPAIRPTVDVPLLRKDFVLEEYQLWESRAAGADAVLLIVAILSPERLRELLAVAKGLSLAALVEAHTAEEVDVAVGAGARVLGINNRDLHTFETRIETTLALLPRIPPGPVIVSESGFFSAADVRTVVTAGAHAVLVGEGLVRADDVAAKIRELTLHA